MADNETIADIIAWLRKPREGENAYLTLWRDEIADRLEAAHRRERGDAAKLREAIMEIRRAMMKDSGAGPATELHATIDAITQAALAAPATTAPMRNCDRFKTAAEAIDAYQDLTGDQLATDSGMKEWVEFAVWLFATATEKEGGNNGNE